jgi:prolyl 4-hydroxylase
MASRGAGRAGRPLLGGGGAGGGGGRRGKPSKAILAALLLASAALLLLLALGALSLPAGSDGAGGGAALSLRRPRFRRSASESCVPLAPRSAVFSPRVRCPFFYD